MNYAPRSVLLAAALATACSQPVITDDVQTVDVPRDDAGDGGGSMDVVGTDAVGTDAPAPTDTPAPMDAMMSACGTARPAVDTIRRTEGLVIAADGTIYYSQARAIGRMRPGMPAENMFANLGAMASTVWGLAIDAPRNRLYAGSPSAMTVYAIDLGATPPAVTQVAGTAGGPNGLTIGPDGDLYYTDFGGGHVYHVPATGAPVRVTTSVIRQANGLAFGPDGSLFVVSYASGNLLRLTLTGGMESARATVAMGLGSPDGIALDARGRFYVTDNGAGRLLRLDVDGSNETELLTGIAAAASVEFGAGALNCQDIYVASSGAVRRYEMGDAPGADVPWHR